MPRRLTTQEFIEKARMVHGGSYDYSRVVYIGSKTKVKITCYQHGPFLQTPSDHLSKEAGCPDCGRFRTTEAHTHNTQGFIKQAKVIHKANGYNYSQVKYEKSNKKVRIVCKHHGPFWQTPVDHLNGHGCPKCASEHRGKQRVMMLSEFIERSNKIHNGKYDYSRIIYNGSERKIEIICPIHGSFWQQARSHYNGIGCPKCGGVGKLTTDEFIQKAQKVHGIRYGYNKVNYTNGKVKVEITCYLHGSFLQSPNDHLGGSGCPDCGKLSKGEEIIIKILRSLGVHFQREKRFKGCRDKTYLPFDFFFSVSSVNFLVEYDGIQHSFPVSGWSNEEKFTEIQRRDAIKTCFAQDNGFILIRIPYTEHENIETILKDEIEKHTGQTIEVFTGQQHRRTKPPLFNPARYKQSPLL